MKLASLSLNNFRQFYGKQKVVFSVSPKSKITFIHAENSAGKTTILNAVLWCMFGKGYCSQNFAHPDQLVNDKALEEGTTSCQVNVAFQTDFPDENGVTEYIMCRQYNQKMKSDKIRLYFKDPETQEMDYYDGNNNIQRANIQYMMQRLIPPGVLKQFFTAGEAAEQTGINYTAFKDSFKTLLGMEYIEKAIKDISENRNDFRKQIKMGEREKERYEKLLQEEISYKRLIDELSEEINKKTTEIEECGRKISEADHIISRNDEPKRIAEERIKREKDLQEKDAEIDENERNIKNWISNNALSLLFSAEQLHSVNQYVNNAKSERITLEYPVNKKLLETLLNRGICICGTKITEKEEKKLREALEQIVQDPKETEKENKSERLKTFVVRLADKAAEAQNKLNELRRKREILRNEHAEIRTDIERLGDILAKNQPENIADAENSRRDQTRKKAVYEQDKARCRNDRENTKKLLDRVERELQQIHVPNNSKEFECANICSRLMQKCDDVIENEIPQARRIAAEKMNIFLANIGNKMTVAFNDENDMEVKNAYGRPQAPGGAEASFIALSFVLAMTEISRERAQKNQKTGNNFLPGLIAPFIFDSVMGVFDETNRNIFWDYIPERSDQMILLLSSTQGGEEIAEDLRRKGLIGKEYYLEAHGNNVDKEIKSQIKGQIRDLKVRDNDVFTKIREI